MAHNPLDKIQALDAIEKEIIQCLQSAGKSALSSFCCLFHDRNNLMHS